MQHLIFIFLFFFFYSCFNFFLKLNWFLKVSGSPGLPQTWYVLSTQGWPGTPDPPVSVSRTMELQVCVCQHTCLLSFSGKRGLRVLPFALTVRKSNSLSPPPHFWLSQKSYRHSA